MKIIHIVPGTGNTFYCENCLRDSARVKTLRELGHDVIAVPMYLPVMTDDLEAYSPDAPIFFGGINVYLQQKSALFRKMPRWIDRIFDSPKLLSWIANRAGMTDPEDSGEMTLSMLRGEDGRQAKELERLVDWLASVERPDVVHISNALLLGIVRRIKQRLQVPVVCSLQDEDIWLDGLPESYQQSVWEILSERAVEVDAFIAVSEYFANLMCQGLKVPHDRVHVVYNGIDLEGHEQSRLPTDPPVIGYLERQCREKGLDILIDAFIILKNKEQMRDVKLRIAGGKTVEDKPLLREVHQKLEEHDLTDDVEFLSNLNRGEKLEFLRSLSVMSVPAEHKEAFGIYVLEALASGVPVVEPNQGAFPELLGITGGGVLYKPNDPQTLADNLERLLLDPEHARKLGEQGREAVFKNFGVDRMAYGMLKILETITG